MTLKHHTQTFVRTDAELADTWRDLMTPLRFGKRTLWLIFIEPDGMLSPVVVPVDDIPVEPDPCLLLTLSTVVDETIRQQSPASAAFLLSRPGSGTIRADDRRWAAQLADKMTLTSCPWPVHLATEDQVQVLTPSAAATE